VTPPRHERENEYSTYQQEEATEAISRGETLIMQCILSGIAFVFVLVAGMTNIPPAVVLRGGIQQVLSGSETLDELVADVRRFGSEWLGWEDGVEPVTEEVFEEVVTDEDVFENVLDEDFFEYEEEPVVDEASNPTVPEPPDTPGLWD